MLYAEQVASAVATHGTNVEAKVAGEFVLQIQDGNAADSSEPAAQGSASTAAATSNTAAPVPATQQTTASAASAATPATLAASGAQSAESGDMGLVPDIVLNVPARGADTNASGTPHELPVPVAEQGDPDEVIERVLDADEAVGSAALARKVSAGDEEDDEDEEEDEDDEGGYPAVGDFEDDYEDDDDDY